MSKKILIIAGIVILVLIFLGSGFYFIYLKGKQEIAKSESLPSQSQEGKEEEGSVLYEDEAGFSFEHPQTLGIVEKEVNDSSVYSSLELSSKDNPNEKMMVRIADTTSTSPEAYLSKNPQTGTLLSKNDISLSGMKGKRLKYENPGKNLVLVTDSGISYFLESPDSPFWNQVFEGILSSFKLTDFSSGSSSGSSGSPIIDEGEEEI